MIRAPKPGAIGVPCACAVSCALCHVVGVPLPLPLTRGTRGLQHPAPARSAGVNSSHHSVARARVSSLQRQGPIYGRPTWSGMAARGEAAPTEAHSVRRSVLSTYSYRTCVIRGSVDVDYSPSPIAIHRVTRRWALPSVPLGTALASCASPGHAVSPACDVRRL